MDVYRPLIDQTTTDLNPYRGNVFQTARDAENYLNDPDELKNIKEKFTSNDKNLGKDVIIPQLIILTI